VDGHEVDLAKLKGKVVLVDFWATWCPECVEKLPTIKALYEKHRGKNFEVVGISLDEDRGTLQRFLAAQKMTWPQYFDGKGWDGKYCQEYQIEKLPALWLVDKQGKLRDLEAGDDLTAKVEKLLAEQ
jgi:thiol-disulfide isomerase/thioredoxin